MGADLILAFVPWASSKAERKKFFEDGVKALTDEQVNCICENCGCGDEDEDGRKVIQRRVTEALDDLAGYRRDTVIFEIEGKTYLFTGGMTWGDDPTDAYGDVRVLAEVWEAGKGVEP